MKMLLLLLLLSYYDRSRSFGLEDMVLQFSSRPAVQISKFKRLSGMIVRYTKKCVQHKPVAGSGGYPKNIDPIGRMMTIIARYPTHQAPTQRGSSCSNVILQRKTFSRSPVLAYHTRRSSASSTTKCMTFPTHSQIQVVTWTLHVQRTFTQLWV